MKRNRPQIKLKLDIWELKDGLYFTTEIDLKVAIAEHAIPDDEIRRRMGAGYHYIADAIAGVGLQDHQASHIEWGILKHPEVKQGNWKLWETKAKD